MRIAGSDLLGKAAPDGWRALPIGVGQAALRCLAAEQDRWTLWLAVAFGAGIGIYFAFPVEPPAWMPWAMAAAGLALVSLLFFAAPALGAPAGLAGAAALGLALAQAQAQGAAAPMLERRLGPVALEGRVIGVEYRPEGQRLLLDRLAIAGSPGERLPARVRLTLRGREEIVAGERIALRAVLLPPPSPAMPDGFDFRRQAWFESLGAIGYTLGQVRHLGPPEGAGASVWLAEMRRAVTARLILDLPGAEGAIAAALMTGDMGAIPADVQAAMRDSGLAHLLSISGLHMSLVAGFVFFVLRLGLALVPGLALRRPIKKWAALAALVATTFYLLFSGAAVPTARAWVMTAVVLLAILVDRSALSMRLLAWAAVAVLAVAPHALVGPSFQMSFAAVVALIAAYEVATPALGRWRSEAGWAGRIGLSFAMGLFTTLIAGSASAFFALYHFNRYAAYAMAANLIAVPLTGLWVMPWAVAAFLLLPLGLEQLALAPMGWGIKGIIWTARWVANWEGAVALLPAMPGWALVLGTLGGLWLCLWRTRWRWWGLAPVLLALASLTLADGPDILVSGDGRLLAVREGDGRLSLSSARAAGIVRRAWLTRDGQDQAETWPALGTSADGRLACDPLGCLYRRAGHVVALIRDPAAIADDCREASLVVATVPIRRGCGAAALVIDRFALWRNGAHAIWLRPDGRVQVRSVADATGDRPWATHRSAARKESTDRLSR